MKFWKPKLIECLHDYTKGKLIADIVAGLIVAIIALPLSIALAIASGVSPEQGLYTAVVAGFVIAMFGGSRVNISGPTAAFATIVAGVVATQGMSGLITATILAGILLILMGLFRFGSLIKYIPMTITTGFTAGIAVTILVGQIKDFLGLTFAAGVTPIETVEKLEAIAHSFGTLNWRALAVGGIGLAILILWPMIGRARWGAFSKICAKIPPSIIAVIVGILITQIPALRVNTIGSLYPNLPAGFPTPSLPSFDLQTVIGVLPSAVTIAVLAAIESLLSCVVSDGMIGDKHNSNTELIAQGAGNICSGLFGGIPATGAIARTAANVKNGGRSPVAGMVHAVVLLLFLLVFMPLAKLIPMPIIAAILFMVAYNMSEWRHFVKICRTSPKTDILVLVVTFVLTVVFDLVVAIAAGLILAAVLFLKQMSDVTSVHVWERDEERGVLPEGVTVCEIGGPLFFADAEKLVALQIPSGTRILILRMGNVPAVDATAMKQFDALLQVCRENGIRLILTHVNAGPLRVMQRAGFAQRLGQENFFAHVGQALDSLMEIE